MKAIKFRFIALVGVISLILLCSNKNVPYQGDRNDLKLRPNLPFLYAEIYSVEIFTNLNMPGKITLYGAHGEKGKTLRTLRYKNITDAVENRYRLPKNIIMSIIMCETGGVDLLPNALGDGGYGISHIQSGTAKDFGLKVYQDCGAVVCNGKDSRSCRLEGGGLANHSALLKDFILKCDFDKKILINYDERLHPILNLDAVGRILAYYMNSSTLEGLSPLEYAVMKYCGESNYKNGYKLKLDRYMKLFQDKVYLSSVRKEFNDLNPNLLISGKKANFESFLKYHWIQNYNYGLAEYVEESNYFREM